MARRVDHLGLRSAMADRLLPMLVGAMSFLAVLAIAGSFAAAALAGQWAEDSGAALTVQVPQPDDASAVPHETRVAAVMTALGAMPDVTGLRRLSADDVNALLRPWLGADAAKLALAVPAVLSARLTGPADLAPLVATTDAVAPGTLAETGARWAARVTALTGSLQASAAAVLLIVALVAAAVISVATRAGLAQGRDGIEIIHGLGALDADIADRFAVRATALAVIGAVMGVGMALPVLYWLAALAAPFAGMMTPQGGVGLPFALWVALPAVPVSAAAIGWVTTQFTVRGWLRRLA